VAVVRATSPRTMGIEFLTLRQPDEGRLRRLLEHLLYGRFR
jgi:hypothetical protein